MPTLNLERLHEVTETMFQVNGKPLKIPPRYRQLFRAIMRREHPRNNVIAPSQDGKSLTIGAATVLVAATQPERFTILAPSEKKADIIMAYVRDFATQHPIIYSQLELNPTDKLDRLKRERSRTHLTFIRGGGVQTLTLDARNGKRSIEAAMGFGSKNIIGDEAGLIEDPLWSTVMRMMGGHAYRDTFLLKIGNPFYRNHFFRSSNDPAYQHLRHDYRDSMADRAAGHHGFDPMFIEEMRKEAFFDVFYECEFPKEDTVDSRNYWQLVMEEWIKRATPEPEGEPWCGADIGGGGDANVYWIVYDNVAFVAAENKSRDTMSNIRTMENLNEEFGVPWEHFNIDDVGIGRGVYDRARELGYMINGVSNGAKSRMPTKYANIKTELSWAARDWLKAGNAVHDHPQLKQFLWIKYKVNSDRQTILEPKDELKKRTGKSPDHWDSFVNAFYRPPVFGVM